MHALTPRRAQIGGVAAALLVAAFLTVQLSMAAFTDTATSSGNRFAAGEVRISESSGGTAVFDVSGVVPGWTETRDVTVDNTSTVDTQVALYASDLDDTGLAGFLHVSVTRNGTPVYSGALTGMPQSFAGATPVNEPPSTSSAYRFTVSMPTGQPGVNAAQGKGVTAAFTWEARSVAP